MKLEQAKAVLTHTLRRRHYSEKTVESYVGWLERYAAFLRTLKPVPETNEERVTAYLNRLAPNVGVSTQKQALCALVFFYREALQEPLGELPAWVSAKRPKRLPEWVTPEEAMALFERMRGPARVLAQLMFGRPIHEVSELLGHANIETTEIYLHCLPRLEERLTSPLDAVQNVTRMTAYRATA